ncbi:MAG: M23 family metallopeptidase [Chloroflexota bacterium]|nr:M23 family metallopeptidase [Chloroflexota bacterium]
MTLRRAGSKASDVALVLIAVTIPAFASIVFGPRGLRFFLNVATALLVLSLPLSVAGAFGPSATAELPTYAVATTAVSDSGAGSPRVSTSARGVIAGTRSLVTVAAEDVRPVEHYAITRSDTLAAVAEKFSVRADDLAYANGISDEGSALGVGRDMLIPPGRGALYFVKDGDTIASVAEKFKVEQSAIMTYNRLYFEPEHFAMDQLIFVPGAEVPVMKRVEITRSIPIPASGQLPARTGRLAWPVNGVLTQYFWWGHTGVDVAAPYGTGIMSSDDGVVVATGWVAVGGLRVCVQHSGGLQTCYYHTSAIYVNPGQTVARGEVIAAIGMTGVTTGPHVHWEAKLNGAAVDPLAY